MTRSARAYSGTHLNISSKAAEKADLLISIPARKVPKAVDRNKVKRWIRAVWRKSAFRSEKGMVIEVRLLRTNELDFQKTKASFDMAEGVLLKKGAK